MIKLIIPLEIAVVSTNIFGGAISVKIIQNRENGLLVLIYRKNY